MRRPLADTLAAALPPVLAAACLAAGALPDHPPPALGMAAAAGLLLGTGTLGLRLARRLLPGANAATRASAATLFALLLVILPVTLLGHLGLLERRFFLPVEAALALAALLLPARPPASAPSPGATARPAAPPAAPWEVALLVAAFAAGAVYLGLGMAAERHVPPHELDDASYHLSAVAVWHLHGDLRMPKFGFGDKSTPHYPVASEMLAWSLLAPLEDSDYLARWLQLPVALASLAAVAAVALALGASPAWGGLAALLYLTVAPAFPSLALSAGNDHLLAFAVLAAVDAALLAWRRPSPGAAVYAGAALGLAVGTKYLGVLFAPPLAVLLAAALLLPADGGPAQGSGPPARRPPLRRAAALLALAAALAVLAGGYTYARNAAATGNPLFPAPIEVAGLSLPGWEEVQLGARDDRPEFAIEPLAFLRDDDRMGRFLPWTGIPAAVLAPLLALVLPGSWRRRVVTALVFALPAVFFAEFLFLVHDHRSSRYLFAGLGVAAVAFAWLGAQLEARWGGRWPGAARALRGVLVLLVFVRFVHDEQLGWGAELALGAVLLAAAAAWARWSHRGATAGERRARSPWPAAAASLLVIAGFVAAAAEVPDYQERKYAHHLLLDWLDRAEPGGTVIAYAGFNKPYPFFGARLQHRVEMVPAGGDPERRWFTWGGEPEVAFRGGRARGWYRNLLALGVEYVVLDGRGGREGRWVRNQPHRYEKLTFHGHQELWRVLPPGPEEGLDGRGGAI